MTTESDATKLEDMEAFYRIAKYPLIKSTDMTQAMREEAVDIAVTAVEKYPKDLEKAAEMIKEFLDKKFGQPWHAVVGRGFSYQVTSEAKHCIYLFVGGTHGVLAWKM